MKQIKYNDIVKNLKDLHNKKCVCFKEDQVVHGIFHYDYTGSGYLYILSNNEILDGSNPIFRTEFHYSWNVNSSDFPLTVLLEGRETYSSVIGVKEKLFYKTPYTALTRLKKKLGFCDNGVKDVLKVVREKCPKISLEEITWDQATLLFENSYWSYSFKHLKESNKKLVFPKPAKKKIVAKKKSSKK